MANSVGPDRSSLFWVHAVCFYTLFVSNGRQLFAADDLSRRHFQIQIFLGALKVKLFYLSIYTAVILIHSRLPAKGGLCNTKKRHLHHVR